MPSRKRISAAVRALGDEHYGLAHRNVEIRYDYDETDEIDGYAVFGADDRKIFSAHESEPNFCLAELAACLDFIGKTRSQEVKTAKRLHRSHQDAAHLAAYVDAPVAIYGSSGGNRVMNCRPSCVNRRYAAA